MFDSVKRAQQLSYLKAVEQFQRTNIFQEPAVYAGCFRDLEYLGLLTTNLRLTEAGKAVLWYQGIIADPLKV